MTLSFVEGAAGTGKTTALISRLAKELARTPLEDCQRVLALTKMHGGRRRVNARLRGVAGLRGRFECITIDSFARRVMLRWRTLGRVLTGNAIVTGFEDTCAQAAALLQVERVQKWFSTTFPIVLVDELQDSKGAQLRLLDGLTRHSRCLAAGDAFQDLDGELGCGAVDWARAQCTPTVLTTVHRTSNRTLLAVAAALRNGVRVESGSGFSIVGVPKFELGAWEVASKISNWRSRGTIAVLSPVGAGSSAFVRNLFARVAAGPLGKQWPVGPYEIPWESAQRDEESELIAGCGIGPDLEKTLHVDGLSIPSNGRGRLVQQWVDRQRRLHGRTEFSAAELRDAITRCVHQARAHRSHRERSLAAMLVHQAKNREFDRVILLWPFEVVGSDERLRRIAYNAVTRARYAAAVIVHGQTRISRPPFLAELPPPRQPRPKASKASTRTRRKTPARQDDNGQ